MAIQSVTGPEGFQLIRFKPIGRVRRGPSVGRGTGQISFQLIRFKPIGRVKPNLQVQT